jgi:hypothetical protein
MKAILILIIPATLSITNFQVKSTNLKSGADSIFIRLPEKADTVNIYDRKPDIIAYIFDRFSQVSYKAPEGFALDVQRKPCLISNKSEANKIILKRVFDISKISDSLRIGKNAFLKRHQFFVIYERQDSIYFHRAQGDYLYMKQ